VSVSTHTCHGGDVRVLRIDRQPGNVLDTATCRLLHGVIEEAAADRDAKLLVLRGAGKHFSFGAGVADHLPDNARAMLEAIGAVLRDLAAFPYPSLAMVQGRCLGGGLELALATGQIYAEHSAVFAAAEIRLGVFAPAATALLQRGTPRAIAEEILLTGRDFSATEAQRFGLVNRVVPDGDLDEALGELVATSFADRSPASLRVATRTLRRLWHDEFHTRLRAQEQTYLGELLELHDGSEGIRAFLDKRKPQWSNE